MSQSESKRVLVIDDEVRICRVLSRILSRQYEVEVVHAASEGLDRLSDGGWDAVVCDLRMPEISGMELYAQATEADPELAGTFIFLSGDLTGNEIQTFLADSGERSVAKPFELDELRRVVAEVVG